MTLNAASVTYASKTVWNIRKQAKRLLNLMACVLNVASKKKQNLIPAAELVKSCWSHGKRFLAWWLFTITAWLLIQGHIIVHIVITNWDIVWGKPCKISSCVLACNNSCCRLREGLKWFTKSLHTDACKYNVKESFHIYRRSYFISALAALSPNKVYFILSEAEDMDWFTF